MTTETLPVRVELWPLAADDSGLWLVSGLDAWRPALAVPSDGEPHWEIEALLVDHQVADCTRLLHSTSWRMDDAAVVLTYAAVLDVDGLVLDAWPDAVALPTEVLDTVGRPAASPVLDAPAPRYIDVVMHAVRHLRFLLDTDQPVRDALDDTWRRHLEALTPALAGMYDHNERPLDLPGRGAA